MLWFYHFATCYCLKSKTAGTFCSNLCMFHVDGCNEWFYVTQKPCHDPMVFSWRNVVVLCLSSLIHKSWLCCTTFGPNKVCSMMEQRQYSS